MKMIDPAKLQSAKLEDIDMDKAWRDVEHLADCLDTPGVFQQTALDHPLVGAKLKTALNQLLHKAVDIGTVKAEFPYYDEPVAKQIDDDIKAVQDIYIDAYMHVIAHAAQGMQFIGEALLISPSDELQELPEDTPQHIRDQINALKDEEKDARYIVAQPHPLLRRIVVAGIEMAGSSEAWTDIQVKIAKEQDPEVQAILPIMMSLQVAGALVHFIRERGCTQGMVNGAVAGVIEAVEAARRAVSLPFIADYAATPGQIFAKINSSGTKRVLACTGESVMDFAKKMQAHNNAAIDEFTKSQDAADPVDAELKKRAGEAGAFGSNGTVN